MVRCRFRFCRSARRSGSSCWITPQCSGSWIPIPPSWMAQQDEYEPGWFPSSAALLWKTAVKGWVLFVLSRLIDWFDSHWLFFAFYLRLVFHPGYFFSIEDRSASESLLAAQVLIRHGDRGALFSVKDESHTDCPFDESYVLPASFRQYHDAMAASNVHHTTSSKTFPIIPQQTGCLNGELTSKGVIQHLVRPGRQTHTAPFFFLKKSFSFLKNHFLFEKNLFLFKKIFFFF